MKYLLPIFMITLLAACKAGKEIQTSTAVTEATAIAEEVEVSETATNNLPRKPGTASETDAPEDKESTLSFQPAFKLSPQATSLLMDIEKEKGDAEMKAYSPSGEIIRKYQIRPLPEGFMIDGFMIVNDTFDEENITKLNLFIRTRAANKWVVTLPLSSYYAFLQTGGIDYFELSIETIPNATSE